MNGIVRTHLWNWMSDRLDDPETIRWCAHRGLHSGLAELIERRLTLGTSTPLDPIYAKAWSAIVRASRDPRPNVDSDVYLLTRRLAKDPPRDAGIAAADAFAPRVVVRPAFIFEKRETDWKPTTTRDLITVDLGVISWPTPEEIMNAFPKEPAAFSAFLHKSTQNLFDALSVVDRCVGLEYDHVSRSVPSISPHFQNEYHTGVYPIIRLMADGWEHLLSGDRTEARSIAEEWSRREFTLFKRLWLHTHSYPAAFSGVEAGNAVAALSQEGFWDLNLQRELMRLLAERWNDFPDHTRAKLEEILVVGPPRKTFRDDIPDERFETLRDGIVHTRLSRLKNANGKLSDAALAVLSRLTERHPQWHSTPGDQSDFSVWSSGVRMGPQGDVSAFANVPVDEIVPLAQRLKEDFETSGSWELFVASNVAKAVQALIVAGEKGARPFELWNHLLWSWPRLAKDQKAGLQPETIALIDNNLLESLRAFPDIDFNKMSEAISFCLRDRHSELVGERPTEFWTLCDRLWNTSALIERDSSKNKQELLQTAINSVPGRLAEILINECYAQKPSKKQGLPVALVSSFEKITSDPSYRGVLARVALAPHIGFLDYIAPVWTETVLVPFFEWTNGDAKHMWEAYVFSRYIAAPQLFKKLKPAFLEGIKHTDLSHSTRDRLGEHLILMLAETHQGNRWPISAVEAKAALRSTDDIVRGRAAWFLWRWYAGAAGQKRAAIWAKVIRPILNRAWPRDRACQSPTVARNFAELAMENTQKFSEAVKDTKPFMVRGTLSEGIIVFQMSGEKFEFVMRNAKQALALLSSLIDTTAENAVLGLRALLIKLADADAKLRNNPDWKALDSFCLRTGY